MEQVVNVHNRALRYAMKHYPNASTSHQYSFASAVAELVTGESYGIGPTIRIYAVAHAAYSQGDYVSHSIDTGVANVLSYEPDSRFTLPGHFTFEEACKFAEPIVFGPITELHRAVWKRMQGICMDDDPSDVAELTG